MTDLSTETNPSNLELVAAALRGSVGADGQGTATCPTCGKPGKFRFSLSEDGRTVIYSCHSGKCGHLKGDDEWVRDTAEKLVALGAPRTALYRLAHQSALQSAPAAEPVGPAPDLPTERALLAAEDALWAAPLLRNLLKQRVGLSERQIAAAGLGWDAREKRFWLPVRDEHENLLTIIRRDFRPDLPAGRVKSKVWAGSKGVFLYAPFGVRDGEPVIIAAGERDCLALCAVGMNAVCFTNGESAAPVPVRMGPLLGRDVVFLYDNDAGNHSKKVASSILPHVSSARVASWPSEIPDGADAWDVLSDERFGLPSIEKVLADAQPWGETEAREEEEAKEFQKALLRARVNERVRKAILTEKAEEAFVVPPSEFSLAEMLKKERQPLVYTIEQIHPSGTNSLIAAQYKAGKTTLMANLAKSYADGDKFLGEFRMNPGGGRIAMFNYELTEEMLLDQYLVPLGIENPDRIVVLNLRGLNFDLRSPSAFEYGVKWLKDRGCDALIVDPFGAAARLANENDNSEARNWLLGTLDPFKEAAGIRDLFMPAHTGRAEKEEGAEHVRGASSVDDWADVRWLYTRAKVTDEEGQTGWHRFLSAGGRGVEVSEKEIGFDNEDGYLFVKEFRSRAAARSEGASKHAVAVAHSLAGLDGKPGPNATTLQGAMRGDTAVIKRGIKEAVSKGWLDVVAGPNNAKFHVVTEAGRGVLGEQ